MIQRPLQMSFYILILCVAGCLNDATHAPNDEPLQIPQDTGVARALDGNLETRGAVDAEVPDAFFEDPNAPKLEPEFVMNQVELLPLDEGFDLNENGEPNNALSLLFSDPVVGNALGGDPNEYIARTVRRGEMLLLMDFRNLNDFESDQNLHFDIFLGRDTDDRRGNNFNGDAEFLITCSSLTEADEPESRFMNATLDNGVLTGRNGQFRFLVSFSNTEVLLQQARLVGTLSPDGQTITNGMMGGAVSFADLDEVIQNDPEIGPQFARVMQAFIRQKLDVDLDGDGLYDSLSAAFSFEAVRAVIRRDTACVP